MTRQCLAWLFILLLPIYFSVPVSTSYFDVSKKPWKKIALTFDDGPRPASTARLKRVLEQYQIPATFFVVGKMAQRYPQAVIDLSRSGHEIANHSWSHPNIRHLNEKQVLSELDSTRELIFELTGQQTRLFRTPGSNKTYLKNKFRVPHHYTLVLWDIHGNDHRVEAHQHIADTVIAQAQHGDIVLLHSGVQATVDALDCIIPELKARGFEFVTVSEILTSPYSPSIIQG